jgi:hypothetical protein
LGLFDAIVQDDGTLLLVDPAQARVGPGPCNYYLRPLRAGEFVITDSYHACDSEVSLASNRFVYIRVEGLPPVKPTARLVVQPLEAAVHTLVAFPGDELPAFDFDGQRLLYGSRRCDGRLDLLAVEVDGPPIPAGAVGCPFDLAGRRLRLAPGRRVRAKVACPRGCHGTATLLSGRRVVARTRFSLTPADAARLVLRPSAGGYRSLRRARRFALVVRSVDRAGQTHRRVYRPVLRGLCGRVPGQGPRNRRGG